jgi:hypothetical protein
MLAERQLRRRFDQGTLVISARKARYFRLLTASVMALAPVQSALAADVKPKGAVKVA